MLCERGSSLANARANTTRREGVTMTTELWSLIYAAALPVLVGWAVGLAKLQKLGVRGVYDRTSTVVLSGWGDRAERTLLNSHENLPVFAAVIIAAHLTGSNNDMTALGALAFAASRSLHAAAYIFGLQPWRSLFYATGLIACVVIGAQLWPL